MFSLISVKLGSNLIGLMHDKLVWYIVKKIVRFFKIHTELSDYEMLNSLLLFFFVGFETLFYLLKYEMLNSHPLFNFRLCVGLS